VLGPLARLAPAPLHPTFMCVVCAIPLARWGPGEGSGWSSLRAPKFKNVELPGVAADIFLRVSHLITWLRSPANVPHPIPCQMADEEATDVMLAIVRHMGMGYSWSKYAAGVVPKQQCVGLHTVLLRRPEGLSQVGFEAIRTVCMVSYVPPQQPCWLRGHLG
jgi:hypothetical protein